LTVAEGGSTISVVSGRLGILKYLLGFLAVVALLRLYTGNREEAFPRRPTIVLPAEHEERAHRAPAAEAESAPTHRAAARRAGDTKAARSVADTAERLGRLAERLGLLAERLDEATGPLRVELDRASTVVCARGWAALRAGRPTEALRYFDAALQEERDHPPALAGRAAALVAEGLHAEAAETYDRLLRRTPNDAAARYNYGTLLYRASRYAEAAEQFRRAIRLDPTLARARYNLATLAQREGRLHEARDEWTAFVALDPGVASAWFNLGVVQMDFDEPAAAADCFARAVELDPANADAWLNLGLARAFADRLEEAVATLTEAAGKFPEEPLILAQLAVFHGVLADREGPNAEAHRRLAQWLEDRVAALGVEVRRDAAAYEVEGRAEEHAP